MLARHFLSLLFPELIFSVRTTEKKIYLTFDDGPTPEVTPWVLDVLKQYNAPATFFCVGCNVEKNPALLSEIITAGHSIGNHTMHHLSGWGTSSATYLEDVRQCDEVLFHLQQQTTNNKQQTNFFRPPYGRITPSQYSSLKKKYRIVMWDLLSRDFDKNISGEKCLQRVITKSKPGSIVVFHDSVKAEKNLRYVLPRALEYFSENGFLFYSMIRDETLIAALI